jgi:hypothetical protein
MPFVSVKLLIERVEGGFVVTAHDDVGQLDGEIFRRIKNDAIGRAMASVRERLGPDTEFRVEEVRR